MKVRVVVQPTGCINGVPWPAQGEVVDVPEVVAESMSGAGHVEVVKEVKVEKRPAQRKGVENRKA